MGDLEKAVDLITEAASTVSDPVIRGDILGFARSLGDTHERVLSDKEQEVAKDYLQQHRGSKLYDRYRKFIELRFNEKVVHEGGLWRIYDADSDVNAPEGLRLLLVRQVMYLKTDVFTTDVKKYVKVCR